MLPQWTEVYPDWPKWYSEQVLNKDRLNFDLRPDANYLLWCDVEGITGTLYVCRGSADAAARQYELKGNFWEVVRVGSEVVYITYDMKDPTSAQEHVNVTWLRL